MISSEKKCEYAGNWYVFLSFYALSFPVSNISMLIDECDYTYALMCGYIYENNINLCSSKINSSKIVFKEISRYTALTLHVFKYNN